MGVSEKAREQDFETPHMGHMQVKESKETRISYQVRIWGYCGALLAARYIYIYLNHVASCGVHALPIVLLASVMLCIAYGSS